MTRLLLALGLVMAAAPAYAGDTQIYGNARFGYLVSYPDKLLAPEQEADNGDGRRFHARHGSASMSVWGGWLTEGETPSSIAREYMGACAGGTVTYKVVKRSLEAFSCITARGRVLYHKTTVRRGARATLEFDYPRAERAIWDPVVKRVAASLKQGAPAG
ncbi:MAG: hypothetical protein JSR45_00895 [Proteobacteria bacterium]|nr:hypothetical protein [Pseudomonadota bacterium]